MSLPPLNRRTLMRSGATVGCLAFMGLGGVEAPASARPSALPLTAIVGWLTVRSDGSGVMHIVQTDAQSHPARKVATELIDPTSSVATTARRAGAILLAIVAQSWAVSPTDCTCSGSRIEHRPSGRSIPFRIWADFA